MIHTAFFSDLYLRVHLICYVQTFISFVASFLHIWMVLAFTAERFFAVNLPLRHMSQCTPNLSRGIMLMIIIPAFLCYIHPAFFVSKVDDIGQCRERPGYERYLNNLNMIDTIMTMFLPFIVVSILNVLIIRKLFCSKKFRQHVFANGSRYQCRRTSNWTISSSPAVSTQLVSTSSSATTISHKSPLMSYRSQSIRQTFSTPAQRKLSLYRTFTNSDSSQTNLNNHAHSPSHEQNSTLRKKRPPPPPPTSTASSSTRRQDSAQRHILTELRLTKMLLAISLTCLSLNFPSYYLRFMFLYEHAQDTPASNKTHTNEIDFAFYRDVIFHYMSYLSYSINIVIYLLFGGNFRRALKRLFSSASSRSENLNSHLRGQMLLHHEKTYGHVYDYDSATLPMNSLGGHADSSKMREKTSLSRPGRQAKPPFNTPLVP